MRNSKTEFRGVWNEEMKNINEKYYDQLKY
jgi:hypothetical protein